MLEFIQQAAIAVITTYLALTNQLAEKIDSFFVDTEPNTTLTSLPSAYTGNTIPQILIENASYQQATLIASQPNTSSITTNPSEALVNIYCTYTTDTQIRSTTGSGFFIDPDGVILTNAHVAQFLLLETVSGEGETACIVRTGETAVTTYEADLLYISPAWILENANLISEEAPIGTGERDYALLYITGTTDQRPMPAQVPHIVVDTNLVYTSTIGDTVIIGGYPALTAESITGESSLQRRTATTTLKNIYTFGTNFGDIYLLGGTDIGVSGISGGPVITRDKTAVGLIVTKGDDTTQGSGSLNAITLSYVNRTILEETGYDLAANANGNLPYRAAIFKKTLVPFLATQLENQL